MTHNYRWCLDVAFKIKEKKTDIPIIFGGIHPTTIPDIVLSNPSVDMIALGESEESFIELLSSMEKGTIDTKINGIDFKTDEGIFRNSHASLISDLDSLPFPDKQLFYDKIPALKNGCYSITSSRGCPFSCTFCCNDVLKNIYKGYASRRMRSVDNVIAELKQAKKKNKISYVTFQDEVFPYELDWLNEFAEKYKKEVGIPFTVYFHFQIASEEKIKLLKDAGCYHIIFGLQSVSQRVRDDICNRHYSNEQVASAVDICKKNDIKVSVEIIFGLPTETKQEYEDGVVFLRELSPDYISTYWLTYYPNTSIIQKGMDAGILSKNDVDGINEGTNSYFRKGNYIKNRRTLLRYQTLYDLIPLLPKKIHIILTDSKIVWKLPPVGYIIHFFFVFLTAVKDRDLDLLDKIRLLFSKKHIP